MRARLQQGGWFVTGMRIAVSGAMLGCLLLSGCGKVPGLIGSGDGDYRGTSTRFQVLRRTCPRPGLISTSIRNGVMFYRWENQYIQARVLGNGTVQGALPGVQLTGTHDGTTVSGDVRDAQCGLHFTLKRVGS